MKLTKKQLVALGIHNSHNFADHGGGKVFIHYIGWCSITRTVPGWRVIGIGFATDPSAHWHDYGCKIFTCDREDKAEKLAEAKQWATEKYGIPDWTRDPFGGWQNALAYERVAEMLKAGGAK